MKRAKVSLVFEEKRDKRSREEEAEARKNGSIPDGKTVICALPAQRPRTMKPKVRNGNRRKGKGVVVEEDKKSATNVVEEKPGGGVAVAEIWQEMLEGSVDWPFALTYEEEWQWLGTMNMMGPSCNFYHW